MNKSSAKIVSIVLTFAAATLLFASLKLPLWKMRMEAPQYREEEALKVAVFPNALRGDLNEIKVLNQYIGVHIPEQLPQLRWLPSALIAAAVAGLLASFLPIAFRRWGLIIVPASLSAALVFAAVQAKQQMHDIGHKRDAKTIMVGVKDFTPPFIGKTKLAQFEISSWFGSGAYLVATAILLQLTGAWTNRRRIVASGISPDVEGGILPPGQAPRISKRIVKSTSIPPGGTPGSTAGETPAATSGSREALA